MDIIEIKDKYGFNKTIDLILYLMLGISLFLAAKIAIESYTQITTKDIYFSRLGEFPTWIIQVVIYLLMWFELATISNCQKYWVNKDREKNKK
jgi:hypothetical protein